MVKIGYDQSIVDMIYNYGDDILSSEKFEQEKEYIQHGTTSTYVHSLCVTYISVWLAKKNSHAVDYRSLIRGALLHDYFLYDWHDKSENHSLHGYTHARQSLKNAERDFQLNDIEKDIIFCHMFPLNLTHIPKTREARIVCIEDKLCAGAETFSIMNHSPSMAGL